MAILLAWAWPSLAYSPEAERVLEALRDKMAAGLAGEAAYSAFLSDLQEADGCETWAADPLGQTEEVWVEIVDACPDLDDGEGRETIDPHRRWPKGGFIATQSVQPRRAGQAVPAIRGEGRNERGGFSISLKNLRPYDRRAEGRMEIPGGNLALQAGHLHPDLAPTRLGFVAGSRFYAGWSGGSGFSGPLESPQASLDGLGLSMEYGGWHAQAAGAWNRLETRGARILPGRRDAVFHALGLSHGSLRMQAVHQRFEPLVGRPLEIDVGGMALLDPGGHGHPWHIGGAVSLLDSGRGKSAPGGYGEFAWGSRRAANGQEDSRGSYRIEAHQATSGWANPLQSPRGYRQDTLDGQWILPGRGEGAFSADSHLPAWDCAGYRADLESGGEAAWRLRTEGLLTIRSRLALIQSLGAWTYTFGTGRQYRRGRGPGSDADGREGSTGFGHIVTWRGGIWRARLSLLEKGDDYLGPYPKSLAILLEHFEEHRGNRSGGRGNLGAEVFTGDIRDPAGYLRLVVRQVWEMGGGVAIRHSLRLPWSRSAGWAGDLGYQAGVEASL